MSIAVVDASVGVKWFVPEVHSAEARQWRSGLDELHTLAFFFDLEIANILWKKIRRGEITRAEADLILVQLSPLPVIRHSDGPLLGEVLVDFPDLTNEDIRACLAFAADRNPRPPAA